MLPLFLGGFFLDLSAGRVVFSQERLFVPSGYANNVKVSVQDFSSEQERFFEFECDLSKKLDYTMFLELSKAHKNQFARLSSLEATLAFVARRIEALRLSSAVKNTFSIKFIFPDGVECVRVTVDLLKVDDVISAQVVIPECPQFQVLCRFFEVGLSFSGGWALKGTLGLGFLAVLYSCRQAASEKTLDLWARLKVFSQSEEAFFEQVKQRIPILFKKDFNEWKGLIPGVLYARGACFFPDSVIVVVSKKAQHDSLNNFFEQNAKAYTWFSGIKRIFFIAQDEARAASLKTTMLELLNSKHVSFPYVVLGQAIDPQKMVLSAFDFEQKQVSSLFNAVRDGLGRQKLSYDDLSLYGFGLNLFQVGQKKVVFDVKFCEGQATLSPHRVCLKQALPYSLLTIQFVRGQFDKSLVSSKTHSDLVSTQTTQTTVRGVEKNIVVLQDPETFALSLHDGEKCIACDSQDVLGNELVTCIRATRDMITITSQPVVVVPLSVAASQPVPVFERRPSRVVLTEKVADAHVILPTSRVPRRVRFADEQKSLLERLQGALSAERFGVEKKELVVEVVDKTTGLCVEYADESGVQALLGQLLADQENRDPQIHVAAGVIKKPKLIVIAKKLSRHATKKLQELYGKIELRDPICLDSELVASAE